MSPLLSLPLELRDKILGFVILSTIVAPPESPNNADDRERLKDTKYYGWSAGCRVLYQKDTQFQGIPTLAINRQLRRETLDIMSLMQLPSLRFYKLDVMIVEERTLWPTWLYIPDNHKSSRGSPLYLQNNGCGRRSSEWLRRWGWWTASYSLGLLQPARTLLASRTCQSTEQASR